MEWQESGSETHLETKYSINSLSILNDLRKSGQLTDAVVVADRHSFPIHRAILSACSTYFRALFTNESFCTERKRVIIPGVTAEAMNAIIDFAYTHTVDVRPDNVEVLLPAADQFHVNGMVKGEKIGGNI